jgi:hypothetical protein
MFGAASRTSVAAIGPSISVRVRGSYLVFSEIAATTAAG